MSRGEGGEGAHATLLSDTLKPNGHTGTDTRPGVWLSNKPTDLSSCVIVDRRHGEDGCVCSSVVRYTIPKWSHRNSQESWGWLCNKPKDLSACGIEECEYEGGVVVKLKSEKRVSSTLLSTGDVRVVSKK